MHLSLSRDFVCAADDNVNDSELTMDVSDQATLRSFLTQVFSIDSLQYSSSHMCLAVKSGLDLALIVPGDREVIYLVSSESPLSDIIVDNKVKFTFSLSREQQKRYGEYRRSKLGL